MSEENEPLEEDELLTVEEASALCRFPSVGAFRIAMSRGQIPGIVHIGTRVRIRRDDLRAYLGLKKEKKP